MWVIKKLLRHIRSHRAEAGERGVAMLELAVVAPFYLVLLISVFDVARMLHHHMVFTEIAQEGARLLSGIPYIEPGVFRWEENTNKYMCVATATDCTNAMLAHIDDGLKHIVNGLYRYHQPGLSLMPGTIRITSEFNNSGDPDWVRVRIRGFYRGFFNLFDNLRIDTQARGPYV
jgi:hypothetical protein